MKTSVSYFQNSFQFDFFFILGFVLLEHRHLITFV